MKYRALKDGEWVIGYPVIDEYSNPKRCTIYRQDRSRAFEVVRDVDIETLSKSLQICDLKGRMIFEGDYIACDTNEGKIKGIIAIGTFSVYISMSSGDELISLTDCWDFEVLDNIYENKDLVRSLVNERKI